MLLKNTSSDKLDHRDYVGLFSLLLLVYMTGLFAPLMDNDSAHHALIALRMYQDGNYAFLIDQEKPYLDKPHFLFWTSAFSYHLFGVTNFAYKFPSFLFAILGTYSTYRLGWLLYNKEVGKLAALILATSYAYMLAVNDVRMDAILTASAIFALWQLCAYVEQRKLVNLILAALGLALAFATKGWVGVAVPAIALLLHLLYKRNWPMLFHWKWLLLIFLFFVFISPVLYAYYLQYDLHPEVEARGRSNTSGVRFILWDQNFERMAGESFQRKESRPAFFLHTFLWAFLPWSFLYIFAFLARASALIRTRFRYQRDLEFMTLGAALFFVTLFSLPDFKLPHYLNILFPFFALLLASHFHNSRNQLGRLKTYWYVQVFALIALVLIGLMLHLWVFPIKAVWVMVISALLLLLWLGTLLIRGDRYKRIVCWSVTGAVFVYFLQNANFYPQLMHYQAGNTMAAITEERQIDTSKVFVYQSKPSLSYDFITGYLHKTITLEQIEEAKRQNERLWVMTDEDGLASLREKGLPILHHYKIDDYSVSRVKWKFLNPNTRPEALTYVYFIYL